MYARQREATGADPDGFAIFPWPEAGVRAGLRQIKLDIKRGDSVREFIEGYAPPPENDTEKYIKHFCRELRTSPERPLAELSELAIFGVMMQYEGYTAEQA